MSTGSHVLFSFVAGLFFVSGFALAGTESASERIRDPFWPVGYVPPEWAAAEAAKEDDVSKGTTVVLADDAGWDAALARVRISGVSRKGDAVLVLINGRVKRLGSDVSVEYAGAQYTWKLDTVDDRGTLKLNRVSILPVEKNLKTGSGTGGME